MLLAEIKMPTKGKPTQISYDSQTCNIEIQQKTDSNDANIWATEWLESSKRIMQESIKSNDYGVHHIKDETKSKLNQMM